MGSKAESEFAGVGLVIQLLELKGGISASDIEPAVLCLDNRELYRPIPVRIVEVFVCDGIAIVDNASTVRGEDKIQIV